MSKMPGAHEVYRLAAVHTVASWCEKRLRISSCMDLFCHQPSRKHAVLLGYGAANISGWCQVVRTARYCDRCGNAAPVAIGGVDRFDRGKLHRCRAYVNLII